LTEEKKEIARDDNVTGVPGVRVRDRIGFDIPPVIAGVPVAVGRPDSCQPIVRNHRRQNTTSLC